MTRGMPVSRRVAAVRLYKALKRHMLPRTIYPEPIDEIVALLDAHVLSFRATPMTRGRKTVRRG